MHHSTFVKTIMKEADCIFCWKQRSITYLKLNLMSNNEKKTFCFFFSLLRYSTYSCNCNVMPLSSAAVAKQISNVSYSLLQNAVYVIIIRSCKNFCTSALLSIQPWNNSSSKKVISFFAFVSFLYISSSMRIFLMNIVWRSLCPWNCIIKTPSKVRVHYW